MHIADRANEIALKNIKMPDGFWSRYRRLIRDEVIPYQWKALNDEVEDAEPSYAIRNFRIAAGLEEGKFGGMLFQDSDMAKWLEAVGYSLETDPDPMLEAQADKVIELIGKAQQPDGYLNTYFTLTAPEKRWTNLYECHELYCAGHMMEAAVAYYRGTGKKKLLDIMCRFADYIDSVFGTDDGKISGYCGHQEVELALMKLYRATGNERYRKLAEYFINERGREPNFFVAEYEKRGRISEWTHTVTKSPDLKYAQAHLPVREQTEAVGHAVRAVYMYTAMADIAAETGDASLLEACRRLFRNIMQKQLYITGGVGSTNHGEAFTFDYDLPNDTVYQETCASIGLIFFAHRMLKAEADGDYADVLERALYNSVLSGMALDGKSFFYVNPLEVWPEASLKSPARSHVKPVRQKWYGCSCCPPNIARLLSSLGQYIYTIKGDMIYTHLFIDSETAMEMKGIKVRLTQKTSYPWDGSVRIRIEEADCGEFTLAVRKPGWCESVEMSLNNEKLNISDKKGYVYISRSWKAGDTLDILMDMPARLIEAHPKVRANAGKVAIQRGPLVYCLEETDNGQNLAALSIDTEKALTAEMDQDLFDGTVVIRGKAFRTQPDNWEDALYRPYTSNEAAVDIKAVPYFLWGNRKQGEMLVWLRRK